MKTFVTKISVSDTHKEYLDLASITEKKPQDQIVSDLIGEAIENRTAKEY